MGILSGNPQKEPLHYGEVFGVWSYITSNKGLIAAYQTLLNHTGDQDLREFLTDVVVTLKQENEQAENVLKANGVALPPTPPERPVASLESIPAGARFNDVETAIAVGRDLAVGLVACSQVIGQSIREDIAMMFGQFHTSKAQFALRLLRLTKEKGWLVPPPLHVITPEPALV